MKKSIFVFKLLLVFLVACQPNKETPEDEKNMLPKRKQPKSLAYELKDAKQWLMDSTLTDAEKELVFAVNRTDRSNFKRMDTIIVPVDRTGDKAFYFPFPLEVPYLNDIDKIVYFSYPTQTFAAYECGILVLTGPTNMGRENAQTPGGLFFTNWKAKKTISTVNDEWELKWNFNIMNKGGIGWHEYTMPGYPASHSCLRLVEADAKYLYHWADQWVLADRTTVQVKGTPVIVFGNYDFHAPKPWLKLVGNPHALDISEEEMEQITEPFLNEILTEQENRENLKFRMQNVKNDA
jgi:hypothetical protein